MRGRFIIPACGLILPSQEIILPNTLTDEGESEFLKMIFQADVATIAAGGNWYVGLTQVTPTDALLLADVAAAEPTVANGYARQALTRDATGWPTVSQVNGETSIRSAVITFTAAGGDFDAAITRMFLTDAASGSVGTLFNISAGLATAITLQDGNSLPLQYEGYMY